MCEGGLIGITHVKEGFNCLLEEGILIMLLKLFSDGSVSFSLHVTSIPEKFRFQVFRSPTPGGTMYIEHNMRRGLWSCAVR